MIDIETPMWSISGLCRSAICAGARAALFSDTGQPPLKTLGELQYALYSLDQAREELTQLIAEHTEEHKELV